MIALNRYSARLSIIFILLTSVLLGGCSKEEKRLLDRYSGNSAVTSIIVNHHLVVIEKEHIKAYPVGGEEHISPLVNTMKVGRVWYLVSVDHQFFLMVKESESVLVKITDQGDMDIISTIKEIRFTDRIQARNGYLYVLTNYLERDSSKSGLQVIDIREPKAPVLVGDVIVNRNYQFVLVDNNAYICTDTGLVGVNLQQPKSPTLLGYISELKCSSIVTKQDKLILMTSNSIHVVKIGEDGSVLELTSEQQ